MNEAMKHHLSIVQERLGQARETIEWLSGSDPVYACGTPVSKADIDSLLVCSRETISFYEKLYPQLQPEPVADRGNNP